MYPMYGKGKTPFTLNINKCKYRTIYNLNTQSQESNHIADNNVYWDLEIFSGYNGNRNLIDISFTFDKCFFVFKC